MSFFVSLSDAASADSVLFVYNRGGDRGREKDEMEMKVEMKSVIVSYKSSLLPHHEVCDISRLVFYG